MDEIHNLTSAHAHPCTLASHIPSALCAFRYACFAHPAEPALCAYHWDSSIAPHVQQSWVVLSESQWSRVPSARRVAPVSNAWPQRPGLCVEMVSAQGLSPQSPLVVGKAYRVRLDCVANTTTRTPITKPEDPGYVGASRRGRILFVGTSVSEGLVFDAGGFPSSFRRRGECCANNIIP